MLGTRTCFIVFQGGEKHSGFLNEAKEWAGELLSGQTRVGITDILMTRVGITDILMTRVGIADILMTKVGLKDIFMTRVGFTDILMTR